MTNAPTTLRIAIGDYPHTLPLKRGQITSPSLKLDFVDVKPMHTAFKPMVREHAYDASEMALVTFFQAKAHNKGLKLLPAAMLARFQHGTMLYNAERGTIRPSDLAGRRIGVRSYSQTTGAWIRGILQNDEGADLGKVQWVTFEDGHVAEARDPAGVIRSNKDMTEMLLGGELDAAIYGAAIPTDPRLQSVIPDPDAAAKAWYARHRMMPVNHMVVVTDELAKASPAAVDELYRMLEAGKRAAGLPAAGQIDPAPFGKAANQPCLDLLVSYAVQQGLISGVISPENLWN
ncbi:MAG: ABC transporter substrate-binding protein [Pseudolabrys sp.]